MNLISPVATAVVVGCLLVIGGLFQIWGLMATVAISVVFTSYLWSLHESRRFRVWAEKPIRAPGEALGKWYEPAREIHDKLTRSRFRNRRLVDLARKYRNSSDSIPDAWVVLNQQMIIEAVNHAASPLLGLTHTDVGRPIFALIRNPEIQQLLDENDNQVNVVEIPAPTEEHVRLELRLIRVSPNQNILIARDVSELNRLLSMRQDFIANVSHELRSPLTVLIGYIESIYEGDLDQATLRDIIVRLNSPAQRMKSLVDDLLMLTRLESSPEPELEALARIDGANLILGIAQEAETLKGENHELVLHLEPDLHVTAVGDELHSAIMNLLTNAIRYSPDGGSIHVNWRRVNQGARFEVSDEGVGIAAEHIPRITERFYRVDPASSRTKGGTGLGLAIVKHVLRRHQSSLQVESKPGAGSTFHFDLPSVDTGEC
ncbi:MAG: phosphate regulon sensor histidine kinase PhoR [Gammaproteobacteria bacterium]|nr:phosphate regulon sensor histidine kinase PhoR [Gammaproteobacteria bacterium]